MGGRNQIWEEGTLFDNLKEELRQARSRVQLGDRIFTEMHRTGKLGVGQGREIEEC